MLLLSLGIDSHVVGWTLLKREMMINTVYFHSFLHGRKSKKNLSILLVY
ncbi:hypothetical protein [Coxiella-like endosymbiont]